MRARSDVAVVTVHVDDVNDHSPLFVFPNAVNNTVHVSSEALSRSGRRHLLIAACEATDADDGPNAQVNYEIANVSSTSSLSSADRFTIGRTSGRLTVRVGHTETVSRSEASENVTFVVLLRASDDGWPSLSTTATLYVVFVDTAAVYWNSWSEAGASSTHPKYRSERTCLVRIALQIYYRLTQKYGVDFTQNVTN